MKNTNNSSKAEYISPYSRISAVICPHNLCNISQNVKYGDNQEAGGDIETEDGGSF